MAELAQVSVLAEAPPLRESVRHSALVRLTHWINTISFIGLLLSGIAILLAHPRLYWGETGAVGGPSLVDLPLPFVLDIPIRGPGRYLHFFFAWIFVLNGSLYVMFGVVSRYFLKELLPRRAHLRWSSIRTVISTHLHLRRPSDAEAHTYNVMQRLSYLGVVFVLSPLIIVTGLAMSPSIVSVFPWMVTIFGGQQSARTLHFAVACLLVAFLVIHIALVCLAGFWKRTRAMITGHLPPGEERP
jgi:thiosulfate reductase cytochrome b subunit